MQLKCQTINPIQILVGFNYTQYSSITAICSHIHVTVLSFRIFQILGLLSSVGQYSDFSYMMRYCLDIYNRFHARSRS